MCHTMLSHHLKQHGRQFFPLHWFYDKGGTRCQGNEDIGDGGIEVDRQEEQVTRIMIHTKGLALAPGQVAESGMPHKNAFGLTRCS